MQDDRIADRPTIRCVHASGFGQSAWLNILLTHSGYVPGLVHAIWIIIKKD